MGCDIHWYSETKNDDKWSCDQSASYEIEDQGTEDERPDVANFPNRDSDYWLFGLLAGVCCEWDWSFEAKGFPEDASKEVNSVYQHWGSDAHTPSWLTRAELKAKLEEMAPIRTALLINPGLTEDAKYAAQNAAHHVTRLQEIITNLSADVQDTDQRIVFWFDN